MLLFHCTANRFLKLLFRQPIVLRDAEGAGGDPGGFRHRGERILVCSGKKRDARSKQPRFWNLHLRKLCLFFHWKVRIPPLSLHFDHPDPLPPTRSCILFCSFLRAIWAYPRRPVKSGDSGILNSNDRFSRIDIGASQNYPEFHGLQYSCISDRATVLSTYKTLQDLDVHVFNLTLI